MRGPRLHSTEHAHQLKPLHPLQGGAGRRKAAHLERDEPLLLALEFIVDIVLVHYERQAGCTNVAAGLLDLAYTRLRPVYLSIYVLYTS